MIVDTAVILAGGRGSRLGHITYETPKPMVMVGDKPILFHIIDHLYKFGIKKFIIPIGYLHNVVLNWFKSHFQMGFCSTNLNSDGSIKSIYADFHDGDRTYYLVYTGDDTLTGGRLKRIQHMLPEHFIFTYGDGISDVDIDKLLKTHCSHDVLVTVTAVVPVPRFGCLEIDEYGYVSTFSEKPYRFSDRINGGFMVMSKSIFGLYKFSDDTNLERDVLPVIAKNGVMAAYIHDDYWHCIDTERDLEKANQDYGNGLF